MPESLSREQIEALIEARVDQRVKQQLEIEREHASAAWLSPPIHNNRIAVEAESRPHSRRWLLTAGAGAAAAGVGSVLATPGSAAAASGSALIQGGTFITNDAGSSETDLTSTTSSYTLNVHNTSTSTSSGAGVAIGAYTTAPGAAISALNANTTSGVGLSASSTNGTGISASAGAGSPAISGTNSASGDGVDGTANTGYGVYGSAGGSHAGVYGKNSASGNGVEGFSIFGHGLAGTANGAVAAIYGSSNSTGNGVEGWATSSTGVLGNATSGAGVEGMSLSGIGVNGNSSHGVDLQSSGTGRIQQVTQPAAGAPTGTTVTYSTGEQIRDSAGQLWLCVAGGAPGTWQKVAAAAPGATGGSTNMLASPFRLYDTRPLNDSAITTPTGPIQSGSSGAITLQVTGTAPQGGAAAQGVPAGAIGIVGTITITNTTGAGYLVVFPTGGTTPGTSNVNMTAAGQTVAASYTAALSSGGSITVQCAGNPTDFILDVTGYIY